MSLLEDVKKATEKLTGWQRPSVAQLGQLPRLGKIGAYRFRDDGVTPNHPYWPLLILRRAVRLPRSVDPAAVFEDLFESNGWTDSWRDGVYDYLHYHSRTHEVLGIARGTAKVRFGGQHGRTIKLSAGDVDPSCRDRPSVHRGKQELSRGRRLSADRHLRRMHRDFG